MTPIQNLRDSLVTSPPEVRGQGHCPSQQRFQTTRHMLRCLCIHRGGREGIMQWALSRFIQLLWFTRSWQLSTTQPLSHCLPAYQWRGGDSRKIQTHRLR